MSNVQEKCCLLSMENLCTEKLGMERTAEAVGSTFSPTQAGYSALVRIHQDHVCLPCSALSEQGRQPVGTQEASGSVCLRKWQVLLKALPRQLQSLPCASPGVAGVPWWRWLMPALVPEGPGRREFWYKGPYLDTKVALLAVTSAAHGTGGQGLCRASGFVHTHRVGWCISLRSP